MKTTGVEHELARVEATSPDDTPDQFALNEIDRFVRRAIPILNEWENSRFVDLAYCVGAECIKKHGKRLATWQGPCSIYIVCDECHATRLDDAERKHMVPLLGADKVRYLGLHEISNRGDEIQKLRTTIADLEAKLARYEGAGRAYTD